MATMISFIILTWNSEKTISKCLAQIEQKCGDEGIAYEVLIVDNGSTDRTVELVEGYAEHMPISLTRYERNRGTTVTRNFVLRKSAGDIICVLDSDASFREGRLGDVLARIMEDRTIGILAPRLIELDGKVQASVKKFPSLLGKISRIPKIIFKINIKEYDHYRDFPFEAEAEVDCAISACWFFRRELLDEVGYLDEQIFYAPEDVDYCIRVLKKGKKVLYFPDFTVLHQTQQITHKQYFSRIALSHFLGLMYYFLKHRYVTRPRIG